MRRAEAELAELEKAVRDDYSPKHSRTAFLRKKLEGKPKVERSDESLVANLVSRPYGYKVVDRDVIDKFEQLRYRIRKLCGVSGRVSHSIASEEILKPCWEGLRDWIFGASGTYWAGGFGASMSEWFLRMAGR